MSAPMINYFIYNTLFNIIIDLLCIRLIGIASVWLKCRGGQNLADKRKNCSLTALSQLVQRRFFLYFSSASVNPGINMFLSKSSLIIDAYPRVSKNISSFTWQYLVSTELLDWKSLSPMWIESCQDLFSGQLHKYQQVTFHSASCSHFTNLTNRLTSMAYSCR